MRTLNDVRAGLAQGATAAEAAKRAKDIASAFDADAATLMELVSMLADAIITPPGRKRGGQIKPPPNVAERTNENIALSEYARLVNARNILDGSVPTYPGYAVGMDTEAAKEHLKSWRLPLTKRQGWKGRCDEKVRTRFKFKIDTWIRLKRENLSTN